MDLESLTVYQRSMDLAEDIWKEVDTWSFFEKDTVGKQLVRAVDSVSANLSEGHGRYHYGENRQFCYYSRGSLQETLTWLHKARNRDLIDETRCTELVEELTEIRRMLNGYIRSIGQKPS